MAEWYEWYERQVLELLRRHRTLTAPQLARLLWHGNTGRAHYRLAKWERAGVVASARRAGARRSEPTYWWLPGTVPECIEHWDGPRGHGTLGPIDSTTLQVGLLPRRPVPILFAADVDGMPLSRSRQLLDRYHRYAAEEGWRPQHPRCPVLLLTINPGRGVELLGTAASHARREPRGAGLVVVGWPQYKMPLDDTFGTPAWYTRGGRPPRPLRLLMHHEVFGEEPSQPIPSSKIIWRGWTAEQLLADRD